MCERKVHDVSVQERLIHVLLHTIFLWHTLQYVCESMCMCASVECVYRVLYGLPFHKSPMERYVCIKDQSYGDKHDVYTLYGTCGYIHMYLCAVKGGSTENQSRRNSTCTERLPKECSFEYNFFDTMCAHMWALITDK